MKKLTFQDSSDDEGGAQPMECDDDNLKYDQGLNSRMEQIGNTNEGFQPMHDNGPLQRQNSWQGNGQLKVYDVYELGDRPSQIINSNEATADFNNNGDNLSMVGQLQGLHNSPKYRDNQTRERQSPCRELRLIKCTVDQWQKRNNIYREDDLQRALVSGSSTNIQTYEGDQNVSTQVVLVPLSWWKDLVESLDNSIIFPTLFDPRKLNISLFSAATINNMHSSEIQHNPLPLSAWKDLMASQAFSVQLIENDARNFTYLNDDGNEVHDPEPIKIHFKRSYASEGYDYTRYVSLDMSFRSFMKCLTYWERGTTKFDGNMKLTRLDGDLEISIGDAMEENGTLGNMCFYEELGFRVEDSLNIQQSPIKEHQRNDDTSYHGLGFVGEPFENNQTNHDTDMQFNDANSFNNQKETDYFNDPRQLWNQCLNDPFDSDLGPGQLHTSSIVNLNSCQSPRNGRIYPSTIVNQINKEEEKRQAEIKQREFRESRRAQFDKMRERAKESTLNPDRINPLIKGFGRIQADLLILKNSLPERLGPIIPLINISNQNQQDNYCNKNRDQGSKKRKIEEITGGVNKDSFSAKTKQLRLTNNKQ
ncbi:hypothetical protein FGO68_gene16252 [Halteria grandinella]|uniref:Uncharacterized protein n=1 Tax=Halteria grandinella TaxID=5974 RepID=A0A8J8NSC0_HALGN|nr:hypothetical protein FGO68_gene16252 [Halteria grandinella]